jgi:hypothetical protein
MIHLARTSCSRAQLGKLKVIDWSRQSSPFMKGEELLPCSQELDISFIIFVASLTIAMFQIICFVKSRAYVLILMERKYDVHMYMNTLCNKQLIYVLFSLSVGINAEKYNTGSTG